MILQSNNPFALSSSRANPLVVVLVVVLAVGALSGAVGCASDRIFETRPDGAAADADAADAVPDTSPGDGDAEPDTQPADGAVAADGPGDTAAVPDAAAPDAAPGDRDAEPPDAAPDAVPDAAADGLGDPTDAAQSGDAAAAPDGRPADVPVAPDRLAVTVEATLAADPWDHVERLWLEHDALTPETFIAKTRQRDAAVVALFDGDAEPPPGRLLLHAAPGWDTAEGPPVLLVHGAGSHATQSFAAPDPLGAAPGLAIALSDAGLPVFAVTFPARFGDNVNQALALAAAIQRVRAKTGAAAVDVVAHSKGGIALLAYLGGMLAPRGVPYADDVGRVALVGVPLGGEDFIFRHPDFNYAANAWGFELPSSWDQLLLYGVWQDRHDESIYGGAYDGLLQTLSRWDDVHPLAVVEQDWYTTYEGGYGFVSHSLGIDAAIDMGGDFIARLRASALPDGLPVAVLAGSSAVVGVTPWETTGPSDALIFVASATDSAWLEDAGATVTDVRTLAVNHWELLYDAAAVAWVEAALTAE